MTLEELKQKRNEIDKQIKELQNNARYCGVAKLDKEHYPTARPDEWMISIKRIVTDDVPDRQIRWISIARSTQKEALIPLIRTIVEDLKGLYTELTGKDYE